MSTHGSMTMMPIPTAARVRRAWVTSNEEVRRSTTAAVMTAVLLSAATPLHPAMQVALAVSGTVLAVAALVDVREHRLPNLLMAVAGSSPLVGAALQLDGAAVGRSFAGALVAGGAMLAVRLARGVGMGDVKMAASVGAGAGLLSPVLAAVAIAVAALAAAGWAAARGRSALPLGPSLWLGWAAALVSGSLGWW